MENPSINAGLKLTKEYMSLTLGYSIYNRVSELNPNKKF